MHLQYEEISVHISHVILTRGYVRRVQIIVPSSTLFQQALIYLENYVVCCSVLEASLNLPGKREK
jgi:hypothetical protein